MRTRRTVTTHQDHDRKVILDKLARGETISRQEMLALTAAMDTAAMDDAAPVAETPTPIRRRRTKPARPSKPAADDSPQALPIVTVGAVEAASNAQGAPYVRLPITIVGRATSTAYMTPWSVYGRGFGAAALLAILDLSDAERLDMAGKLDALLDADRVMRRAR